MQKLLQGREALLKGRRQQCRKPSGMGKELLEDAPSVYASEVGL